MVDSDEPPDIGNLEKGVLEDLKFVVNINGQKFPTYRAGMSKGSPGPECTLFHGKNGAFNYFFRDGVTSAAWREDWDDLRINLEIAALTQGRVQNRFTGEEHGKIVHEMPGYEDRKGENIFYTDFNSCDGANGFIIGEHYFWKATGEITLLRKHKDNLRAALGYNFTHMDRNGVFYEDTLHCGDTTRTRMRCTIWKDSGLIGRNGGQPKFPIAYAIQQAHLSRAFRDAADIARVVNIGYTESELRYYQSLTKDRLFDEFWGGDTFVFAIDGGEMVHGIFSDALSLLGHLDPGDISSAHLDTVIGTGMELGTQYGFRTSTYQPQNPDKDPESYQFGSVWPPDQEFINEAGHRHNRPELIEGSLRWLHVPKDISLYEFFRVGEDGNVTPGGFNRQLWPYSLRLKERFGLKPNLLY